MRIDCDTFLVRPGANAKLADRSTRVDPFYPSKDGYKNILARHVEQLSELQARLTAADQSALLVVFQGMDAAGKDGAIRHVMSGVNPQGVDVSSFKEPSAEELEHDFLWRETLRLPKRGRIGIFNRSYYEDVLVVRVHPELLAGAGIHLSRSGAEALWDERFRSIRHFERHLDRNGTRVVKFFLHVSKEEQRRRLLARIDDPSKNWKFSLADVKQRGHWRAYLRAHEECLTATSRDYAPWYVVPADDKLNARLIVSQVIIDALATLKLRYPRLSSSRRRELAAIRKQLERR
jgi:PPK2 family polyphosphate:nucleotide phosphotransferase